LKSESEKTHCINNEVKTLQNGALNSSFSTFHFPLSTMKNTVAVKSLAFALRVVKLYKYMVETKKEYVLSKQTLRADTVIGALIREAEHGQSKADFLSKMNIALNDGYWLFVIRYSLFPPPSPISFIFV